MFKIEKSSECMFKLIILIPTNKKRSPILFIKKAFVAAFPACIRVYQKLINKYELSPTPSHPKNKTNKLLAGTKTSIKNVNNERNDIKRVKKGSAYI